MNTINRIKPAPRSSHDKALSIGFVLPASGGGGGANSIVQEALGLSRWGCAVSIFVNSGNAATFQRNYPELLTAAVQIREFDNAAALGAMIGTVQIACATTALSVQLLRSAMEAVPKGVQPPQPAYYVQDYEPLFFDHGTPSWSEAFASYTLIPGMRMFAKTDWICAMVEQNHGTRVSRVQASIDHEIYYPDYSRPTGGPLVIAAMVRPKTRRRAPFRTARILNWLAREYPDLVHIEVFGCSDEDLKLAGVALPEAAVNHGQLRRTQVPQVLRRSDMFLDLSDYQAFGRTGLEAMSSGCIPVVPVLGGSSEYAVDGKNAFVVDTRSDEAVKAALRAFIAMSIEGRHEMKMAGIETAMAFSIDRAVSSELALFESMLRA
ncbi:glycosyltransferase [Sphingomonas sp. ID0503]|uniref:glycosyltransferase n=1 Tax=Sphingomonas sp. ID0503 TaxID=3399691 RepID=UPI003AFB0025